VIGATLGLVAAGLSATVWESSPALGVVIAVAFFLNTLVSVSLGGLIPLGLKALNADAALGAPPILTTLSDMCGLAIVLTLAYGALLVGVL